MSDSIYTPEGRVAFANLLEAREEQSGGEFFSCTLVIPGASKDDPLLKKMRTAANAAAKEKFGSKIPKNLRTPFISQDSFLADNDEPYAGFEDEDLIAIRVKTKRKPGVISTDGTKLFDDSDVYSGMYAELSLTCYAYDNNGNKGVSFGLKNVLKTRDGDRISGGGASSAEDDFAHRVDKSESDGESIDDVF